MNYLEEYRPQQESLKFFNWNNLMFGNDTNETPKMHFQLIDELLTQHTKFCAEMFRGSAKAVSLDSKIITPYGYKLMKDICIGDIVFDRNGKKTTVTHISEIFNKPMFKIILNDGQEVKVSCDHINIVRRLTTKGLFKEHNITTSEIIKHGVHYNRKISERVPSGKEAKWFIPVCSPVDFYEQNIPLDPYTVGLILGDGNIGASGFSRIHSHIDDVFEIKQNIPYQTSEIIYDKRRDDTVRFSIIGISKQVKDFVGVENCYKKKIPHLLKIGSYNQRIEVLRGLMDTDGTIDKKGSTVSFTSVSKELAFDVASIVRSLGGRANISTNNWTGTVSYRVFIMLKDNPFKLKRKAELWKTPKTNKCIHTAIVDIIHIDNEPSRCIAVDSDTKSFLVNDYIVTHNTTNTSHKMPLYVAMLGRLPNFGQVKNAVLISDTFEQADTQLQSCMAYYTNSDKLQNFLTLLKRKEGMLLFENNKGDRFHIAARGAGQSFRGTNYEGQRPQWIIGDDLQGDEILTNKDAAKKLISWWVGTVLQAVDISRFKITVIGTPMLDNDLISSLMRSPEYHTVRFKVAQEFSTDPSKIISAWADRFTPQKIISMYHDAKALGAEAEFFREMFLEVSNEETQIFKADWFKEYSLKELRKNKGKYNFFTSMDLAVSRKDSADRSVIMTIAVNGDGHWFVVDMAAGRFSPTEVIDILFKQVSAWKPLEVRAEKAALQQVLSHFIDQKMLRENRHFLMNSLEYNSTTKKEYRILGLQPKFKARMIHFPNDELHDEVVLLKKEILGQTKETNITGHDDCLSGDTLVDLPNGSQIRIDEIQNGTEVMNLGVDSLTNFIKDVRPTGEKFVREYYLENGDSIKATDNHPFLTQRGYVYAGDLTTSDFIVRITECRLSNMDTNGQENKMDITSQQEISQMEKENGYINMFGLSKMEHKNTDTQFITKTETKTTTQSQTWSFYQNQNTQQNTEKNQEKETCLNLVLKFLKKQEQKLKNGINQKQEENGILNMVLKLVKKIEYLNQCACHAGKRLIPQEEMETHFALQNVMQDIDGQVENMTKNLYAQYVEKNSTPIRVSQKLVVSFVGVKAVGVKSKVKTYNFEVPASRNFSINGGYIVHNCPDTLANFNDPNFVVLPSDYDSISMSYHDMDLKDSTVF